MEQEELRVRGPSTSVGNMSSNRKRKIEEQPQLAIKAEVAEDHQLLLSNKVPPLFPSHHNDTHSLPLFLPRL